MDRVHFIDVHRSGLGDYLQDVGVFLVMSNLRHPIQDGRPRAPTWPASTAWSTGFAAEFARLVGDEHFQSRLLAVAGPLPHHLRPAGRPTRTSRAEIYLHGVRLPGAGGGRAAA